ncbi:AAA family ATPase [Fictibacillus fluitans]|uniref:AAA family ATPase n=1 Tax=Fictibacillus fluitans TaxID=3058422 RepID=A0ABT8I1P7_9BACL|nr:AAA family ATPase [Fictibacillus sp. NE201]MDN4526957.1 AAA family ATPase [Fictibacillus sp. NE201]
MWIKKLHIYHFGKFHSLKMDQLSPGPLFISGENEAGKTTLKNFITCMLFGFPSKVTNERRYEPKDGNRIGGSITIHTDSYGDLTIERVAGKAAGNVTVYGEGGLQGGEELLHTVLKGMDRSLFQGIYCFGLEGLQEIEKLSSEQLGDYLLSAGMTGSRELQQLESQLEKRQSMLFKPGGKKPVINELLQQLESTEEELRTWRRKNEEFQPSLQELKMTEAAIRETEAEKKKLQDHWYNTKKWKSVLPALQKWKEHQLALQTLPENSFPENGLHRLEQLQEKRLDVEGELLVFQNRVQEIEKQLKAIHINEEVLFAESLIVSAGQKSHDLERLMGEKHGWVQKAELVQLEARRLLEETGFRGETDELEQLNTGLAPKNELLMLIKKADLLDQKKGWLDQELENARGRLESAEEGLRQQKGRVIEDQEFHKLKERAERDSANRRLLVEREQLQAVLANPNASSDSKSLLPLLVFSILAAACLIYLAVKGELFGTALFAVVLGAGAYFWIKSSHRKNEPYSAGTHNKELLAKIRTLEDELSGLSSITELDMISERYADERAKRAELERMRNEAKRLEHSYQQQAANYDKLELEQYENEAAVVQWCNINQYKGPWRNLLIPGYFEKIEKLKESVLERKQLLLNIAQADERISGILKEADTLTHRLRLPEGSSYQGKITEARLLLQQEKEKLQVQEALKDKLNTAADHLNEQLSKKQSYDLEINTLLSQAKAKTEEDYRLIGGRAETRKRTMELLEQTSLQLQSFGYTGEDVQELAVTLLDKDFNVDKEHAFSEEQLKEKELQMKKLQRKSAELSLVLQTLQDEESYSECLQRYENLRNVLKDQAKMWSVHRIAADLLKKTKEQFHAERLPAIIQQASQYFTRITNGKYVQLYLSGGGQDALELERHDGVRFHPGELSRGTAEQLYLCVRLSLASLYQKESLPLIVDDITVNFDAVRTKHTLDLLTSMGSGKQLIFFTCHEHLFRDRPELPVITLKKQEGAYRQEGAFS